MVDVETRVKEWGSSLGIRIPRALLAEKGIGPGDRVHVQVEKAEPQTGTFWGSLRPTRANRALDFQTWKDAERRRERARDRSTSAARRKA